MSCTSKKTLDTCNTSNLAKLIYRVPQDVFRIKLCNSKESKEFETKRQKILLRCAHNRFSSKVIIGIHPAEPCIILSLIKERKIKQTISQFVHSSLQKKNLFIKFFKREDILSKINFANLGFWSRLLGLLSKQCISWYCMVQKFELIFV